MVNATLTDSKLFKILWLGLAVTLPLFGVPLFRYKISAVEIPIPIYVLGAITAVGILSLLMRIGRIRKTSLVIKYRGLGVLCLLFFVWHLTSVLLSTRPHIALTELVKVGTGLVWFWAILALFPRDERFLKRFWSVVLWSSVPLLMYLIVESLLTGNPFLSTDVEDVTAKLGTNQLGFYLSILGPYFLFYFWGTREKLRALIPLLVFLFVWVYIAIRAAWLSVTVASLYSFLLVWRVNRRQGVKLLGGLAVSVTLLIGGSMWFLSSYTEHTLAADKFAWLFAADPQYYTTLELNTSEDRWGKVMRAWNDFTESPIVGVGLRTMVFDPHNDYMRILTELGVVGEVLFLGILAFICGRLLLLPAIRASANWVLLATPGAAIALVISLNFLTTYSAPHFWVFLGLLIVAIEAEREPGTYQRNAPSASSKDSIHPVVCGTAHQ